MLMDRSHPSHALKLDTTCYSESLVLPLTRLPNDILVVYGILELSSLKFCYRIPMQSAHKMFFVMLQTSCTLALYNVTKENLILVAKISKESSDTNQKPPTDLLKREKVCVDITELVHFRL